MTTAETPEPQSTWTIVSQCKSDRVVYYTDDSDYHPPMEGDWYYCSIYQGPLPAQMNLRNCWGWRFRGSQFQDARETTKVKTAEKLLDSNRKALHRLLRDKIDEVRKPYSPSCLDGNALRQHKLREAQAYLAQTHAPKNTQTGEETWPFLMLVAQSRHCTLQQAAQLICSQAHAQERMWLQTERFREQMTQLIHQAHTQLQMMELREWLLDAVYPELSKQFRYPISNTEPIDASAPLKDTERLHETTRLQSVLRDTVNTQRKNLHTDYVLGEQIWQHKLRQAQQWLNTPVAEQTQDLQQELGLLTSYAQAKGWGMQQAAQNLLQAAAAATQTLLDTEGTKDKLLAQIEKIQTWADIHAIEDALQNLGTALPSHRNHLK